MRDFMIMLRNIARTFLLFEKSMAEGHKDDILKELKENRKELQKLRESCINKISNQEKK